MSRARYWPVAATLKNKIYVSGGEDESGYLTTLECFDTTAGTWQMLSPMPIALTPGFSVATLGRSSRMHVFGSMPKEFSLSVTCFDACTNKWNVCASSILDLSLIHI